LNKLIDEEILKASLGCYCRRGLAGVFLAIISGWVADVLAAAYQFLLVDMVPAAQERAFLK
jgi:hypothetical protein